MTRNTVLDWLRALMSWTRIRKFVSVGVIGAVLDTAVLLLLVEAFGILEEAAVLAGIEASILFMFLLNEYWTFRESGEQGRQASLSRLGRSHMVRFGGVVVQFAVFVAIYRSLFVPATLFGLDAWLLFAKLVGILIGTVVNYVFESLFTWRVHAPQNRRL
jgi:putative flippase GtrA